ncbi:putative phosphoribosyltransferase [Saccharothrix saharensis]|uniref:Putative phosphoribosyltransferase n=1 Tax=Saccharothrix saharensis TaxID=571190 RepID=A0A543JPU8_9PSEU|nr:phosphoribosyltransferase family protein [Saccharothrix saharensis]TQM84765.1 putative phosphoribosyltransferase [Saccharothrix saharensis]
MRFADRSDAGRVLARALVGRPWTDPLVLGLARGGVPVAFEVASALGGELDVAVARKIGAPGHPEYGIGAVTATGEPLFDPEALRMLGLTPRDLAETCAAERREARRRLELYRDGPVRLGGRDVLVVDDGLATGVTARAALRETRGQRPRRLVLAVPVGAADAVRALGADADLVVCPHPRADFRAVGRFYAHFEQTSDEQVVELLRRRQGAR